MTAPISQAAIDLLTSHRNAVVTTIKKDGRPQLSVVGYVFDPTSLLIRASITDTRAKTRNLRRDPRASVFVTAEGMRSWAVFEGEADLSPVAADPHDATVEELVEIYRILGGEHPDWDEYRAAMVADQRLVFRLKVDYSYGLA